MPTKNAQDIKSGDTFVDNEVTWEAKADAVIESDEETVSIRAQNTPPLGGTGYARFPKDTQLTVQ